MITFPYHQRAYRRAGYCLQILAAASLLLTTAGCEKAKDAVEQLTGPGSNVPSEIADACLVVLSMGSEARLRAGHKFSELIGAIVGPSGDKESTWEKSTKGYIWRRTIHNDLQQTDTTSAIEFVELPPRDKPAYDTGDCGPKLLRAEAGLINGQPFPNLTMAALFSTAANHLSQHKGTVATEEAVQRQQSQANAQAVAQDAAAAAAQAAAAASQAAVGSGTDTASAQGPITAAWLRGVWGPAEYNPTNNPNASCDTDSVVRFFPDGTYSDGGSEGRYRTDGKTITYFNRILVDYGADTQDRSQFNRPLINRVKRIDNTTFEEQGATFRRCNDGTPGL